jgi:hypothetical protein
METGGQPSFGSGLWGRRYAIVYLALVIRFVVEIGRCYDPTTGLSSLIYFGDQFAARRITSLSAVPLYTYSDSSGYDGQFYAQLAVAGNPFDPELKQALDNPGYRARRMALPALAHLIGLGRPGWIVQVFALANLLCFLILAALLARWWFPPTDLHNLLRWVGTLFGAGMMVSVTRSLTDGPALLAIAIGARLVERKRGLIGAAVLAAAGLVRETSVVCAAAFAPTTETERRAWPRAARAIVLCVAPTFLWAAIVGHQYGGGAGKGNLALPFASVARKLAEILSAWRHHELDVHVRNELFAVIALATEAGFLLLQPRPERLWWRIGAAFSVLWIFLGWSVWEGSPSSAARAVLPLTLAFNQLVPRTRRGLVFLLAGNLTVASAFDLVRSIPTEQTTFERGVTCRYRVGWHAPERLQRHTWRWAAGSAALAIHNPTSQPLRATVSFGLGSVTARTVTLHAADDPSLADRSIALEPAKRAPVSYGPLSLPPGDSAVAFTTVEPPWVEPGSSKRPLTFSVHDLTLAIAPADAAPPP